MKRIVLILLATFALMSSQLRAADAAGQFEKMKSLVGEWQGQKADGKPVTITYELVSNGSALMERLVPEGEANMITMYHLDGAHLLMTHYCSAMNQPRMRSEGGADNVISFAFLDATNLAKPTDGHMQKLVVTFKDENHITQAWTFRQGDQEHIMNFELSRKMTTDKTY